MKIRSGFVSNSSSSSFIIGAGEVKNKKLLNKYFKDNKIKISRYIIIESGKKIVKLDKEDKSKEYHNNFYEIDGKNLSVQAMVNSEPKVSCKFDKNKNYIIVSIGNDEGDDPFLCDCGEYSCDLRYDRVNYDWFSEEQRKIIDIFTSKDFLKNAQYKIGAERNG